MDFTNIDYTELFSSFDFFNKYLEELNHKLATKEDNSDNYSYYETKIYKTNNMDVDSSVNVFQENINNKIGVLFEKEDDDLVMNIKVKKFLSNPLDPAIKNMIDNKFCFQQLKIKFIPIESGLKFHFEGIDSNQNNVALSLLTQR